MRLERARKSVTNAWEGFIGAGAEQGAGWPLARRGARGGARGRALEDGFSFRYRACFYCIQHRGIFPLFRVKEKRLEGDRDHGYGSGDLTTFHPILLKSILSYYIFYIQAR